MKEVVGQVLDRDLMHRCYQPGLPGDLHDLCSMLVGIYTTHPEVYGAQAPRPDSAGTNLLFIGD